MSVFFYHIFLWLFQAGIRVASLFSPKAKKWLRGRKGIFAKLEAAIPPGAPVIWVHCASLGEFEQGRPLMEKLRADHPRYRILLTFFSPSGYEVQKDYKGADWVFYLPADGPRNAKRFLEIVHPSLVIFVKYEFWFYYLKKISYRNIPFLLVSALFRRDMSFFRWYGALQRKMLTRFDHLFVQNRSSLELLHALHLDANCSVSGDTRFDRVLEIADRQEDVPGIASFAGDAPLVVAGSTWPEDEAAILAAREGLRDRGLKWVLAPHEISPAHIRELQEKCGDTVLYSAWKNDPATATSASVLIIDSVGLLSRLYRHAHITFVGGGLRKMGVHNVLEAAVYGKPVLFGPCIEKYAEAVELVQSGGGIVFGEAGKAGEDLAARIERLLSDTTYYEGCALAAGGYVRSRGGATQRILDFIQEKRLLTN